MIRNGGDVNIEKVKIENPDNFNFILGQSHFIKTVEDIQEALVQTVPDIKYGLAFCEASGPCLIRYTGTDDLLIELAKKNAANIGAGHSFIIFLKNAFPINIMNSLRNVPEICRIFCATANPTQVLIVQTDLGRGIVGVVDGSSPKGFETEEDMAKRKEFLRKIGYKIG